jgi:hypothetical protein
VPVERTNSRQARRGAQTMHDMIGSGGMLRGWMEVWSAHMSLLLATLIVSVGAAALVGLLTTHLRTARSAVAVDSIHSDE